MLSETSLQAGFARVDITPKRPVPLAGQHYERLSTGVRDPLLASAVALSHGQEKVILVSCDVVSLPDSVRNVILDGLKEDEEVGEVAIFLAATHTHCGPYLLGWSNAEPRIDNEWLEQLIRGVQAAARLAWRSREAMSVHAISGFTPELGYQRLGLMKSGRAAMYYGSWNDGFSGVAGPRDGEIPMLLFVDGKGVRRGVITSFASHPNCCSTGTEISADLPGETRRNLQRVFGSSFTPIYLTGAAGDTCVFPLEDNPHQLLPWTGPAGLERAGLLLSGAILQALATAREPMSEPVLALKTQTIPARMQEWPEDFDPATEPALSPESRTYFQGVQRDWESIREAFCRNPPRIAVSVIRIGDAVICLNPAELYVELGLAIKRESPAKLTLISELTDGFISYVPTRQAFRRGGYGTWPHRRGILHEGTGESIVNTTVELMNTLFTGQCSEPSR